MFRKLKKSYTPKMIAEAMQMQGYENPELCQRCGEAQRGMGTSFCERCSQTSGTDAGDIAFHDDDLMSHERSALARNKTLGEEDGEPEPSPEELEAVESGDPQTGEDPRFGQKLSPEEQAKRYQLYAAQEGEEGYQGW
jgi:hypothetical protein